VGLEDRKTYILTLEGIVVEDAKDNPWWWSWMSGVPIEKKGECYGCNVQKKGKCMSRLSY